MASAAPASRGGLVLIAMSRFAKRNACTVHVSTLRYVYVTRVGRVKNATLVFVRLAFTEFVLARRLVSVSMAIQG